MLQPGRVLACPAISEGLIQIAKQLPDAGWCRAPARVLKVLSTDSSIIASEEFGRSCRVGRCCEQVLHLVRVGQWMQVRSGCCQHRCSRRLAGGRSVCLSGRLVCCPRGVAQCLPARSQRRTW
jgi:hypothetical protein